MDELKPSVISRAWKALGWRTAVLIVIAAAATYAFAAIAEEMVEGSMDKTDVAVSLAIHSIDTATLDQVMIVITTLGAGITLGILAAAFAGYCLYRKKRRLAFVLIANALAGWIVNLILKHSFARPRPTLFDEITRPSSFSFPSGHSMSSMAIYGTLAVVLIALRPSLKWIVIPFTALLIAAIGFSRIYLGVHWMFDVLAGFAAGIPWVLVAIHLVNHTRRTPEPGSLLKTRGEP